jgi:hypothetical protein
MPNYGPRIVTDNLIMYLDAANPKSYPGSGASWTDLSGNGCNAALQNGPTFVNANGGYLNFDGTNDYADLANASKITGNQVSFGVWITILNINSVSSIVWLEGGGIRYFQVHLPAANTVYFDAGDGSGGSYDRVNKNLEGSGWQYWTFTKNSTAGTMKIYLNGNLWVSGTGKNRPVGIPSIGYIGVGGVGQGIGYAPERVSNMHFYNKELSASEILQNYNATKGRFKL